MLLSHPNGGIMEIIPSFGWDNTPLYMTLPDCMTLPELWPTTIFSVKLMHLCTIMQFDDVSEINQTPLQIASEYNWMTEMQTIGKSSEFQLVVTDYSLVLKGRHVSVVRHMNLIRPNTLLIKGAMTLFWTKPFYKFIVMPLFRIIPNF